MEKKIKVLLCDDMPYICEYFETILNSKDNIEVVGTANDSERCFELFVKKKPDVVLLDMQMETEDEGIQLMDRLLNENPQAKIIILTIHEDDELIFRAFSGGACDYILKSSKTNEILDAVIKAYDGDSSLNPCIAKKIINQCAQIQKQHYQAMSFLHSVALLTASEYKILRLIYEGFTYSEIAQQRFVEEVTIRTQVNKILKKFNANNMKQLIKQLQDIKLFEMNF